MPFLTITSARARWTLLLLGLSSGVSALAQSPVVQRATLSPAANARSAPRTTDVVIPFSQSLNPATAGSVRVHSVQRGGQLVRGGNATVSGSTLTVNPATDLRPGETVVVTVPAGVQSTGGVAATKHVYQFTAASGGTGAGSFMAPATNPDPSVGQQPRSVAVGDLDADGDLDFVTANMAFSTSSVSVRLNNGTGSFGGGTNYTVPSLPSCVVLGDVDGDGDLDFLSTGGSGTVSVRVNNGSGSFSGTQDIFLGDAANSIVLGDVDADGDLDFLTANANGFIVMTWVNNGAGVFSSGSTCGVISTPYHMAVGDMDSDGDLDVLVATAGGVSVRLNNGAGTFSGGSDLVTGNTPNNVALGDVDADGDLDMLASNSPDNTVSVRLNDGSGAFSGTHNVGVGNQPQSLAVGDLDADGDLDLLTSNLVGTVTPRFNDGTGTFSGTTAVTVGSFLLSVAMGDLDGDLDLDFVAANSFGSTVSVRLNIAPPTLTSLSPSSSPIGASVTLTGTDLAAATAVRFNGIAATSFTVNSATSISAVVPAGATSGNVTVVTPTGTTNGVAFTITPALTITSLVPTRNQRNAATSAAVAVTFDQPIQNTTATQQAIRIFSQQRGGRMFGTQGGTATVSGSTLSFDPMTDFQPGETVFVTTTTAVAATGTAQLARGHVHQFTTAVGGTGTGTFASPATNPNPSVGGGATGVTAGDIDNDGDIDFVASIFSPTAGSVILRRNDGSGSFTGSQSISVGPGGEGVVLGDVDGDGDLDILAPNGFATTVSVRVNDGLGNFSGTQDVSVGASPAGIGLGDIDADGDLDLLTAHSTTPGTVSVRLNDGTGTFSGSQSIGVASYAAGVTLGDIDADGDLDLLVANASSQIVNVRLNNGAGTFSSAPDVSVSYGGLRMALRDIDGDNDLDLLVANRDASTVSVRFNNGSGTFSGTTDLGVGQQPQGFAVVDVDADGDLDILTGNTNSLDVSLLRNSGNGTFGAARSISLGTGPVSLATADVDADGDVDFITTNSNNTTACVRLNVVGPVLTSLSPTSGPIGTTVTLTGINFTGATAVSFNGTAATTFTVVSNTTITATVPAGATTGNVTVTTPADISGGVLFTVQRAPTALALSPTSIAENAAANALVGSFTTTDPNPGDTFTYALVTGTGDTHNAAFTISTNQLRIVASPDYETQPSYSIRVSTTDQTGLAFERTFTITVTNVNEAPTALALSNNTVAENTGANVVVGTLSATDPDAGATLTYTLVSGFGDNALLNLSGNQLRITASPDYEAQSSYNAKVRVTDNGGLFTEQTFTIAITDVADLNLTTTQANVLCFGQATGSITVTTVSGGTAPYAYDWAPGTPTGDGTATISNLAAGSYSVTVTDFNGLIGTRSFTITQPAAALTTNGSQVNPTCGLANGSATVTASGGTGTYSYTWNTTPAQTTATATNLTAGTYEVTVRDVNSCTTTRSFTLTTTPDNTSPVAAARNVTLTLSGGTATLTTAQFDNGSTDNCGITTRSLSRTTFSCADVGGGGASGGNALKFDGSDDYVNLPAGVVNSAVVSGTGFTFEAWVNFAATPTTWTRIFDFGTGTNKYFFLTPNANTGRMRFAIKNGGAEQLIENPSAAVLTGWHHYAVTLSKSGTTVTGRLYLDGTQVGSNTAMTIMPGDLGALTQVWLGKSQYGDPQPNATYEEVRIWDVARTQAELQASRGTALAGSETGLRAYYPFNQTSGTALPDATGHGYGGTLLNFLLSGTASNWVASTAPVSSGILVTLTVADAAGNSNTANAYVTVSAGSTTQAAPTAVALSATSVAENVPAATTIGTLSTTDPNGCDTHTYTLVTGAGSTHNSAFTIVGNALKINASPDYETQSSYSIRVRTTDSGTGNLFFEQTFTITITDVVENLAPTALALSNAVLAENVAANTTVGTFSTTDPDAGNTHTYSLVSGAGSTHNAAFSISGNQLRLTASPDYEAQSSYAIRVRTTDQGSLFFEQTFTITITDVAEALLVNSPQTILAGSYTSLTVTGTGVATLGGNVAINGPVLVQHGGVLADGCHVLSGAGTFTLTAGATLRICSPQGIASTGLTGAVQLAGTRTYSPHAAYEYTGGGAQITGAGLPAQVHSLTKAGTGTLILSAPVTVRQLLTVSGSGNFDLNGLALTLRSDADTTATLWNAGTGRVLGATATVQRYLSPTANPGLGYRHLAPPVTGSTITDLTVPGAGGFVPKVKASFNNLPIPSIPAAQFPNVFGYDETHGGTNPAYAHFDYGYVSPLALTDALVPGRGQMVYIKGGLTPDFVGTFNQDDVTLSLTRTGTAGPDPTITKAGWSLLGNPFASLFDWDLVSKPAALAGTLSVFRSTGINAGAFLVRTNGVGGMPDGLVAPGQAFFVRVDGTGPVSLTLPNSARVNAATNVAIQRPIAPAVDTRPLVRLTLRGATAPVQEQDEAFVYFEAGATAGLDSRFDGQRPAHNVGAVPTLSALTAAGEEVAIDGLPETALASGTTVELRLALPTAGAYSLHAAELRNLTASAVTLLDRLTNTTYDLGATPSVAFSAAQAGPLSGRFALVFGATGTVTGTSLLTPGSLRLTVFPNPASGAGSVQLTGVSGRQVELLNGVGQRVRVAAVTTQNGTATLELTGLPAGVYTLRAANGTRQLMVE